MGLTTFFAVCVLAAYSASAQVCTSAGTVNVDATSASGSYTCVGSRSQGRDIFLNFTTTADHVLYFSTFTVSNSYCAFNIAVNGNLARFSPSASVISNPGPIQGARQINVGWTNTNTYSCGSFELQWKLKLPVLSMTKVTSIYPQMDGGFSYMATPYNARGRVMRVMAIVESYQGIQPPAIFASVNGFPILERFDVMNESVALPNNRYRITLDVINPREGWYGIGIFLYGSSTAVSVSYVWDYNLAEFSNNVAVNATVGVAISYVLPRVMSSSLLLQLSRAAPGGFPIAYVSSRGFASPFFFEYSLDTSKQSYVTQSIRNPDLMYVVTITCANQADTFGFLMKASW